jgi:NAD(P)-dependent dehydrogenase (short-subunit alcohol dehydrogenase family)
VKDFACKTAVVTGGASGICRGMADRFARAGMNVVLADIETAALDRAVGEMRGRRNRREPSMRRFPIG